MNTIAQGVRPGTASRIPTMFGNPADSIGRSLKMVKPKSRHSWTNVPYDSLVHRVHAPTTELAQAREHLQEPSDEDKLHAKLLSYLKLPHDWDGHGAVPPSLNAVLDTITFLDKRPSDISLPFPQIASDGEVGLYWRTDKIHVEIGFYGDGELSYYARYTATPGKSEECGRDGCHPGARNWPQDLVSILNKL